MKMQAEIDDRKWILAVRDQIVKANPKILTDRVFDIFTHGSMTMEFFHERYEYGDTPAECFKAFIEKFGKHIISL